MFLENPFAALQQHTRLLSPADWLRDAPACTRTHPDRLRRRIGAHYLIHLTADHIARAAVTVDMVHAST
jgi:hypothetical protein